MITIQKNTRDLAAFPGKPNSFFKRWSIWKSTVWQCFFSTTTNMLLWHPPLKPSGFAFFKGWPLPSNICHPLPSFHYPLERTCTTVPLSSYPKIVPIRRITHIHRGYCLAHLIYIHWLGLMPSLPPLIHPIILLIDIVSQQTLSLLITAVNFSHHTTKC